jgi:hypothetical protein
MQRRLQVCSHHTGRNSRPHPKSLL